MSSRPFRALAALIALLGLAPAGRAQTPKTQPTGGGDGTFIPALNARVRGVRFFEGPDRTPAPEERVYRVHFPRSATRYVYFQLQLEFPEARQQIEFPAGAVWYRPDGSVMARSDYTFRIQPSWESSHHNAGRGWDDPGNWPVGSYYVDVFVYGSRVARAGFTIDQDFENPIGPPPTRPVEAFVGTLGATVTEVQFFEGPRDIPPLRERTYLTRFSRSRARFINWQLDIEYPEATQERGFVIEAVWYRPDGSTARQQESFRIERGWTSSSHAFGRGWDEPGNWLPGMHYVELFVNGVRVGYDRFIVDDN